MVEIEKPRIECIDSQDDVSYGKYIVEPLERGYGTTPVSYTHLKYGLKVLGNGSVSKKVTVKAAAFSESAKEKIEKAGGKAEVV